MNKIEINKRYFDACIHTAEALFKCGDKESCADYIKSLAHFAWGNCTGYYTSWRLEKLLNQIGSELPTHHLTTGRKVAGGGRRILHVASSIYETGGHTRLLLNWMKNDADNEHQIVLTATHADHLPKRVLTEHEITTESITVLAGSTLTKASALRDLSLTFDLILLHVHPDDVIPVVAFSHTTLPPVIYINHADHTFWLGASITDHLVQVRVFNFELDAFRRKISSQFYIPIPLKPIGRATVADQVQKRTELNISADKTVLLSTGSDYKFVPFGIHNFYESCISIVKDQQDVTIYIAGVDPDSPYAKTYAHPQIHYLGRINNLADYETACDIYLEGFPSSSLTSMIQPAMRGKPIHLMYRPYDVIRIFTEEVDDFLHYAADAVEWKLNLQRLIRDKLFRNDLQARQYDFLRMEYAQEHWNQKVKELYTLAESTSHAIIKHTDEVFLMGENEQFLSHLDFGGHPAISHFAYCKNLDILSKMRHLRYLTYRTAHVQLGKRDMARFFLPIIK